MNTQSLLTWFTKTYPGIFKFNSRWYFWSFVLKRLSINSFRTRPTYCCRTVQFTVIPEICASFYFSYGQRCSISTRAPSISKISAFIFLISNKIFSDLRNILSFFLALMLLQWTNDELTKNKVIITIVKSVIAWPKDALYNTSNTGSFWSVE